MSTHLRFFIIKCEIMGWTGLVLFGILTSEFPSEDINKEVM